MKLGFWQNVVLGIGYLAMATVVLSGVAFMVAGFYGMITGHAASDITIALGIGLVFVAMGINWKLGD